MASAKKRFVVQSPVDHDGTRYLIGEPIDLEEAAAKPLVEAGAIVEASGKKSAEKTT